MAGKGLGGLEGRAPTKGDGATQLQTTREWQTGPGTTSCFPRGTRNTGFCVWNEVVINEN